MEDLLHVMRIIDDNSHNLPEGDYLQVCNLLQNAYKTHEVKEMTTLFDYENFAFHVPAITDDAIDHFYNEFYELSIDRDIGFLEYQAMYLKHEIERSKPLKRVTKYIKTQAIKHYCWLRDIELTENTSECLRVYIDEHGLDLSSLGITFNTALKFLYKMYLDLENQHRSMYTWAMRQRLSKIDGWIQELET